jgi:glycolate oxidase FAD binding subunit
LEKHPEDMTVTVEAGVSLSRLNHILAEHGQRIALDHAMPERATIGGIVAADSTAGLCYGFGTPRDLVLGMTVVDGQARLLHVGGKVVKNVSGYDLPRLFTGSHGTLGIIASVTLRTHPLPDSSRRLRVNLPSANDLDRVRTALFASHLPLVSFDFVRDIHDPNWGLIIRVEGTAREVDYQTAQVERFAEVEAEPVADEASPVGGVKHAQVVVRILAAPSGCVAVADRVVEALREKDAGHTTVAGRLGDGFIRTCTVEDDVRKALGLVRTIVDTASAMGSHCVVERAPVEIKRLLDVWGERPNGFALMRRVKEKFDPAGILSPGRYVGKL